MPRRGGTGPGPGSNVTLAGVARVSTWPSQKFSDRVVSANVAHAWQGKWGASLVDIETYIPYTLHYTIGKATVGAVGLPPDKLNIIIGRWWSHRPCGGGGGVPSTSIYPSSRILTHPNHTCNGATPWNRDLVLHTKRTREWRLCTST